MGKWIWTGFLAVRILDNTQKLRFKWFIQTLWCFMLRQALAEHKLHTTSANLCIYGHIIIVFMAGTAEWLRVNHLQIYWNHRIYTVNVSLDDVQERFIRVSLSNRQKVFRTREYMCKVCNATQHKCSTLRISLYLCVGTLAGNILCIYLPNISKFFWFVYKITYTHVLHFVCSIQVHIYIYRVYKMFRIHEKKGGNVVVYVKSLITLAR